MAGNYPRAEEVGSYSHPYFTTQHEAFLGNVAAAAASATAWAKFRSRNKILVSRVSLVCISAPSATAGSLHCVHYDTGATATTLKSLTIAACSAGWATSLSFTGKTLGTLTEYIALMNQNNEKGDFEVIYEYQVLYPATYG